MQMILRCSVHQHVLLFREFLLPHCSFLGLQGDEIESKLNVNINLTELSFFFQRSIGFYWICSRISQNVHNSMFNGIISTTMHFFDTNPSGRILNRFAKDMGCEILTTIFISQNVFV